MYMYPVITSNTTTEMSSNTNNNTNTQTNRTTTTTNNNNTNMPRNRSLSAASSPPPALLSRGFASLRRAHRRLSNSSPSSPITGDNTTAATSSAAVLGSGVISNGESRSLDNNTNANVNTVRPRIRLVPNVELSSRSFVFDVIDRELESGTMYRIGRFSDRNLLTERISFKSKVTSRNHAELWTENGKVYIRDIGSSSGTFLNRIRLSPPNHVSTPHEIKDADSIQLGVDYQGGLEPIYRAVRIRVELNRQYQTANNPYARSAFQQLRSQFMGAAAPTAPVGSSPPSAAADAQDLRLQRETTRVTEHVSDIATTPVDLAAPLADMMGRHNISDMTRADIQECCICLYAMVPQQALFIAPCSHMFHFRCLKPIIYQNYPGFACPLCRNYFDLEASVAVEVDDVLEAISVAKEQQLQQKQQQELQQQQITPVPEVNEEEEQEDNDDEEGTVERSNTDQLIDVTVESSIHPISTHSRSNSSDNNEIEQEAVELLIENRHSSAASFLKTPPVPYSVPSNDHSECGASSPLAQAIEMNSNRNAAASQLRSNRNEDALLSTTLVGSPVFEESVVVLPSTTALQNEGSSNIVS